MEKEGFVNDAFEHAINEYLRNKVDSKSVGFNSFFSVIIRLLVIIYDELDIITPYKMNNPRMLVDNLKKYGVSSVVIDSFLVNIQKFYLEEDKDSFVLCQKAIIDMFACKKRGMDISDGEISEIRNLLYSPYADNPLIVSYNFLINENSSSLVDYFDLICKNNIKEDKTKPKEYLNFEAYEILRYSIDDIRSMNSDDLEKVNHQVYSFFDINSNAINKNYLLDKAVFDYNNPKLSFSTGNGYVDILFVLALISTLAMVAIIVAIVIF